MANVRLKRLKIEKYRHVAPGTELVFNDTFNVLLGQNGTGKTTLLNLIAMVVASDFSWLKDEEFAFEYELAYPGFRIGIKLRNERDTTPRTSPTSPEAFSLDVSRVMSPGWSYRIALRLQEDDEDLVILSASPHGASLEFKGHPEKLVVDVITLFEYPIVWFFTRSLYVGLEQAKIRFAANPAEQSGSQQSPTFTFPSDLHANLFVIAKADELIAKNCGRFDEALGAFNAMVNSDIRKRAGDLRTSAAVLRQTPGESSVIAFNVPAQLVQRLGDWSTAPLEGRRIAHLEVDFLQEAVKVLGFDHAEILLRLANKEPTAQGQLLTYGNFEFFFTLEDGSIIRHDDLSYGQKRLLSFFYYAAANPDIVIADELVNGMHYDWIEACMGEIGGRQAFLTSQNPLLLDFLPFTSVEEVQRCFVLCSREKRDGRSRMIWANLNDDDARSFFRAYQTEAQHVSEILRTKGL